MRGADSYNEALFFTVKLEGSVPTDRPLRPIRTWVSQARAKMDVKFSAMYEADVKGGRPSIAPEKVMRAMLLQVHYSVPGERQLVEQISYNLLFRWFVGLAVEDTVWNHSVFSKNRDRLIEHEAVTELFNATVEMANQKGLLSGEHFSVDGTLIQAWASHKSIRRKDGCDARRPPEDWHGGPRGDDTHESTTGPESRLYRKSHAAPALPDYLGHVLTHNPHGLVVNVKAGKSEGKAGPAFAPAARLLHCCELPMRYSLQSCGDKSSSHRPLHQELSCARAFPTLREMRREVPSRHDAKGRAASRPSRGSQSPSSVVTVVEHAQHALGTVAKNWHVRFELLWKGLDRIQTCSQKSRALERE